MLELTRPYGAPVRPFVASYISYGLARETWQAQGYWALRREIFCRETNLFAAPDAERDEHDVDALPLVATAHCAGNPESVVGVVRIYETEPGLWYGGRLGVTAGYRARGQVGARLIETAVTSAAALGCRRFLATVLMPNVEYFRRYHFAPLGELEVCGRAHMLMQADLGVYAPAREGSRAWT
jgi:putative N-acetyltransferase (TIGR04045 family)